MLVMEKYTEKKQAEYYLKSERDPGYVYFDDRGDFNGYLALLQDEPLRNLLIAYSDEHADWFPLYENRDKPEGEIFEMVKQGLAGRRSRR
jgi:hypothetical protein